MTIEAKASIQRDEFGRPYRSFRDLLATITRNQVRFPNTTTELPMLAPRPAPRLRLHRRNFGLTVLEHGRLGLRRYHGVWGLRRYALREMLSAPTGGPLSPPLSPGCYRIVQCKYTAVPQIEPIGPDRVWFAGKDNPRAAI